MLTRSLLEALYNPQYQTPDCQGRVARYRAFVLRDMPTPYTHATAIIIYANKHLSPEAQDAFAAYIIRGDADDLINFSRARWSKSTCYHENSLHEFSSSSSSSSSSSVLELSQAQSPTHLEVNEMPPLTATETIILFTAPAPSMPNPDSSTINIDSDPQDVEPVGQTGFKATLLSWLGLVF